MDFRDFVANCIKRKSTEFYNLVSAKEYLNFVKNLSTCSNNTDEIIIKLIDTFRKTPPREEDLIHISLLYQENQGKNTPEEYAVLTIWLSMLQFIIETENYKKQIHTIINLVKIF